MKIAFIGLGTMGSPMAGHLAARHEVTVYNRTRAKAETWQARHGGIVAATAADAARGADAVLLCLPSDDHTAAVALREGVLDAMTAGAILVDHGSGAPEAARRLATEAGRRGIAYLDAPVSGGEIGAREGRLAVMIGGRSDVLSRVQPALRAFAQDVRLMGPVGAGQATKLVNVIIGHGTNLAVAEALGFALREGLDPARVVDVLMKGSSRSWVLEHRSGAMIGRDYENRYSVNFARKDLGAVLAAAGESGAVTVLSALADGLLAALQKRGFGDQDMASLIEHYLP